MSASPDRRALPVTCFSDYICPFCYVGDARLGRLAAHYDLEVDWCFFEIHPDNPPEGRPIEELGYPPEVWARMMANLERMAAEEGLALAERRFTTSSHAALLLAEAAKEAGAEVFAGLHRRLFEAYFAEQRNIGDRAVLAELAAGCGLEAATVQRAWQEPRFEQRLAEQQHRAAMLGIGGVPAFLLGRYLVQGAVPVATLEEAARRALADAGQEVAP